MQKLGIIVGENETERFIEDLRPNWQQHYAIEQFSVRKSPLPFLKERTDWAVLKRDLIEFMSRQDIVFCEWASSLLRTASFRPKNTPIVVRLHRYEMYKWVNRINWNNVDRVILVSDAMRAKFIERCPDHAHKAVTVTESVSLERFPLHDKPFGGDIGILCHIAPRKRVYELVLAFYDMLQRDSSLKLHIGGAPIKSHFDYDDALRSLVRRLGIVDKVRFYGRISDASAWYKNVDIIISNGYNEGLQVVPMEAMASGCYCLAHHWDGADQLVAPEQLYITNGQLVERVLTYCARPESEKQAARQQMRAHVAANFDARDIAAQIRTIFNDALDPSSAPDPIQQPVLN